MRKRKILASYASKCKPLKLPTVNPRQMEAITINEFNNLSNAFSIPSTSYCSRDELHLSGNSEERSEIESVVSEDISYQHFDVQKIDEEDINSSFGDVSVKAVEAQDLDISTDDMSESRLSPLVTDCSTKLKGSEWLKLVPEITTEQLENLQIKRPYKKRSFVKGGYAEQLDHILTQQHNGKFETFNKILKLKVINVCAAGGLLISRCSVIQEENGEKMKEIGDQCILVVRNQLVEHFSINLQSTLTIQQPWQVLTPKDEKISYLIGPVVLEVNNLEEEDTSLHHLRETNISPTL